MTDVRESILARLLELAEGLVDSGAIRTAKRNGKQMSEEQRPAILILDADETADEGDPVRRPNMAPRQVGMTPEMYLLLGDKPENVGTAINALRAAWLRAVLTDATLAGLVGSSGYIRYEGCATALAAGRNMNAEMGVSISFHYLLNPSAL